MTMHVEFDRARVSQLTRLSVLMLTALTLNARVEAQLVVTLSYTPHEEEDERPNPFTAGFGMTAPPPLKLDFSQEGAPPSGSALIGEVGLKTVKTPVYSARGTIPFLTEGAKAQLREWGFPLADDAPLTLHGSVIKFFVEEAYAYEAKIVIEYSLRDAARQVLWKGEVKSQARNFGTPSKAANYREVLSDALRENLRSLISTDAFRAACMPATPSREGEKVMTPELLKADVLRLMKEGFAEDLLVDFVGQVHVSPAFASDDLLAWKNAGISTRVISAAMKAARSDGTK